MKNCHVEKIAGDFDIHKNSHNGDLEKTASKTPVRNLTFEKHDDNFKIMETKNPKICDTENLAVYDLNTRNVDPEFSGKYRQHQLISESMTVNDDHFDNLGSVNYEKFVGNLVLNHLGWSFDIGGRIQVSSENKKVIYIGLDSIKYNLNKITVSMANRTFKIFTPKIMMKTCELDKGSAKTNTNLFKLQGVKPKDLTCSQSVFIFKQYSKAAVKTNSGEPSSYGTGLRSNMNRSAESVVESTKHDWKNSNKKRVFADKEFLSKIKKDKRVLKHQAMTCY